MTQYIPLIDTNTKAVYQWTKVDADGSETIKDVSKPYWKPAKDWTEQEKVQFFAGSMPTTVTATITETVVEAAIEETSQEVEDTIEEEIYEE